MPEELFTIPELAKRLREMAEMTAKFSRNWDNYQAIVEDALRAVDLHARGGADNA